MKLCAKQDSSGFIRLSSTRLAGIPVLTGAGIVRAAQHFPVSDPQAAVGDPRMPTSSANKRLAMLVTHARRLPPPRFA